MASPRPLQHTFEAMTKMSAAEYFKQPHTDRPPSEWDSEDRMVEQFLKPGSGIMTLDFMTFGMLIIDDILFPIPRAPIRDVLGGAGSYAAMGARLFRKNPHSCQIGWVVHRGSDFPAETLAEIKSWGTLCRMVETPKRLTTRGLNIYQRSEQRDFEYMTDKLRVEVKDLTERQLTAKTYHLICSPERCIELITQLFQAHWCLRVVKDAQHCKITGNEIHPFCPPLFVWEPVPPSCVPSEMEMFLEACQLVDVVSPNDDELKALFGETETDVFLAGEQAKLERMCNEIIAKGFGKKPAAVVVRRGKRGCYVASLSRHTWMPAYHQPKDEMYMRDAAGKKLGGLTTRKWTQKVVDPTGGGNAFLGGCCIGLLDDPQPDRTPFEQAAIYGSVAASFAIEQIGMPKLTRTSDGQELWNGESVAERLEEFSQRVRTDKLSTEAVNQSLLYLPIPDSYIEGSRKLRADRVGADVNGRRLYPP